MSNELQLDAVVWGAAPAGTSGGEEMTKLWVIHHKRGPQQSRAEAQRADVMEGQQHFVVWIPTEHIDVPQPGETISIKGAVTGTEVRSFGSRSIATIEVAGTSVEQWATGRWGNRLTVGDFAIDNEASDGRATSFDTHVRTPTPELDVDVVLKVTTSSKGQAKLAQARQAAAADGPITGVTMAGPVSLEVDSEGGQPALALEQPTITLSRQLQVRLATDAGETPAGPSMGGL